MGKPAFDKSPHLLIDVLVGSSNAIADENSALHFELPVILKRRDYGVIVVFLLFLRSLCEEGRGELRYTTRT